MLSAKENALFIKRAIMQSGRAALERHGVGAKMLLSIDVASRGSSAEAKEQRRLEQAAAEVSPSDRSPSSGR